MELLGMAVRWPIIAAPMAGGPSTPALAAAVTGAGGLGFLAGGYLTAPALGADIAELRRLTPGPFGVNLFVPQPPVDEDTPLLAYLATLRSGGGPPAADVVPAWDDDHWSDKLDLLARDPVPLVSFTFGCPPDAVVSRLRQAGSSVVITVTTPDEAGLAAAAGADGLAVQGIEAGGHQGSFHDDVPPDTAWGLLALIAAVRHTVDLPVIAAGGLMTAPDVAAVLRAGAVAAQLGTAFLRTPESGAHPVYRTALADPGFAGTAITRAFSGRRARGLVNDFMRAHPDAPSAYPQINNATRGLRRAALDRGDPHGVNLWAGQGFRLAQSRPAAEIVTAIGAGLDAVAQVPAPP